MGRGEPPFLAGSGHVARHPCLDQLGRPRGVRLNLLAALADPLEHLHVAQLVGETAAKIKKLRKADPYKGKGLRLTGEVVRRKQGKTGKK